MVLKPCDKISRVSRLKTLGSRASIENLAKTTARPNTEPEYACNEYHLSLLLINWKEAIAHDGYANDLAGMLYG